MGLWLSQFRVAAVVTFVALPAATIAIALPRLEKRRAFARHAARMVFRLSGMPLVLDDLERLPAGPSIVVANHASYLDGIVMMATLPPRFSFLIKSEMSSMPFVGLLLRRLGMAFVARTDTKAAAGAAARLIRAAKNGNAIGVFPEGTFRREPGLRQFRRGAFQAAARAHLPVVPVVIRGTRSIFPAGARLFRPRPIQVRVLPAIVTESGGRESVDRLRSTARDAILQHCAEPDATAGEATKKERP
ncbi:MAG TPA: lysophospholipid acyltransferase family protein [Gammaproteobacteria bacterium]|nr:lysophospholipid acyltransferase family protein [Gammaproteobacteria bacterium]